MTQQRLHSALAPVDVLTRLELEEVMHKELDAITRERYRGIELQRVPYVPITAAAATLQLFTSNDATPWGPEQGDIWRVFRVNVKSSILTDTAKYTVYRGSTPSDLANAYSFRFLLDGFVAPVSAVTQPVPATPTVGASPFTYVNTNPYTVNVTVSGGTVSSITVNGTNTGATSGTFALLPDANMTVTYTVVPATFTVANANANVPAVALGQNVNIAKYSARLTFLQPGEQVYAQVTGATVGNQYVFDAECIRCPAEMKGKIL